MILYEMEFAANISILLSYLVKKGYMMSLIQETRLVDNKPELNIRMKADDIEIPDDILELLLKCDSPEEACTLVEQPLRAYVADKIAKEFE